MFLKSKKNRLARRCVSTGKMWIIVCKISLMILAQPYQETLYVHFTITWKQLPRYLDFPAIAVIGLSTRILLCLTRSEEASSFLPRCDVLLISTRSWSARKQLAGFRHRCQNGRKKKWNVSVETARFRGLTTLKFCDPRRGTVERGRRGWWKGRRYGQRYRETRRARGFFLFFLPTYGNRDKIGDGSRNR